MAKQNDNKHSIKIERVTAKGGQVKLNAEHGVYASYAVATAGDIPSDELFFAGITLTDGNEAQFFCNRETGLIDVGVVSEDGDTRTELFRMYISGGNISESL